MTMLSGDLLPAVAPAVFNDSGDFVLGTTLQPGAKDG